MSLSSDPNMCEHEIVFQEWIEEEYDDWHGNVYTEQKLIDREENYLNDIDLHRMQCRYCGKIEYYSNRARKHFEDGEYDGMIDESNQRFMKRNVN